MKQKEKITTPEMHEMLEQCSCVCSAYINDAMETNQFIHYMRMFLATSEQYINQKSSPQNQLIGSIRY